MTAATEDSAADAALAEVVRNEAALEGNRGTRDGAASGRAGGRRGGRVPEPAAA